MYIYKYVNIYCNTLSKVLEHLIFQFILKCTQLNISVYKQLIGFLKKINFLFSKIESKCMTLLK